MCGIGSRFSPFALCRGTGQQLGGALFADLIGALLTVKKSLGCKMKLICPRAIGNTSGACPR